MLSTAEFWMNIEITTESEGKEIGMSLLELVMPVFLALIPTIFLCGPVAAADPVDRYDVAWDTPGKNSSDSMPLGNGDIGLNVWTEENGDVVFYISKTDAWSENAQLLKLGRVRISASSAPSPADREIGVPRGQVLKLSEGSVEICVGKITYIVWVDANLPAIRIEAKDKTPFEIAVNLEVWRTSERAMGKEERSSVYGMSESPDPVIVYPDTILTDQSNRIAWYHRNEHSIWPLTMNLQGMGAWIEKGADPLMYRTFGGIIEGEGLVSESPTRLKSEKPASSFQISIYPLTAQTQTSEEWIAQLEKNIASAKATGWQAARDAHVQWWRDFWKRSWVRVSGASDAETVSRGYVLQRFISACAGRGAYPIKFNGSIFTVDAREKDKQFDADYRSWGGPYWFQNTRLPYWPMLASGDYDMMLPLFKMFQDALPFALARTQAYFGHGGAFFPETMYFWGAYANDNYGWDRKGKEISYIDNTYIRWYWSGALELIALMLDYHACTSDDAFLGNTLVPMADAVLAFYDEHYTRDASGKILFKPAQSLETWQQAVNPSPEIAGLGFVLDELLALPEKAITDSQRQRWSRLRGQLPALPVQQVAGNADLPIGSQKGETILAPAQEILADAANSENPELYAIFPYRLFGVGKPDLDMARLTFEKRRVKGNNGWRQDDTQAAFLGLTDQARKYIAERFATKNPGSRFPAFWGPNFDWIPDQDHGANGLMTLQTMLLQTDGQKILLFPAWPKDWDVEFKLHAPLNTIIEGKYASGKLESLNVTPPERQKDIVNLLEK